jgi:hypothetical protein
LSERSPALLVRYARKPALFEFLKFIKVKVYKVPGVCKVLLAAISCKG